jgi:hypothetical protein
MTKVKAVAAVAAAFSALMYGGAANGAESLTGVYLSNSPGKVEYLSLTDSGQSAAVGFFEALHALSSVAVPSRTKIFSTRVGNTLRFGRYTAMRTADGFILTSVSEDGGILQEHFIRSTVADVNNSVVALQESAIRHSKGDSRFVKIGLSHGSSVSSSDTSQLWKAQADINTAQAQLSDAQDSASRMCTLATQARAAANAAINEPGVSLAQNQGRMQAMTRADEAEQNEVAAEHRLVAVAGARADVERLRSRVAKAATHTLSIDRPSTNEAGP